MVSSPRTTLPGVQARDLKSVVSTCVYDAGGPSRYSSTSYSSSSIANAERLAHDVAAALLRKVDAVCDDLRREGEEGDDEEAHGIGWLWS